MITIPRQKDENSAAEIGHHQSCDQKATKQKNDGICWGRLFFLFFSLVPFAVQLHSRREQSGYSVLRSNVARGHLSSEEPQWTSRENEQPQHWQLQKKPGRQKTRESCLRCCPGQSRIEHSLSASASVRSGLPLTFSFISDGTSNIVKERKWLCRNIVFFLGSPKVHKLIEQLNRSSEKVVRSLGAISFL